MRPNPVKLEADFHLTFDGPEGSVREQFEALGLSLLSDGYSVQIDGPRIVPPGPQKPRRLQ